MMSTALTPLLQLSKQTRACAPVLMAGVDDPHAEWLAMVWGPRFDREHALGLWADLSRREPLRAMPVLPVLMKLADGFDALAAPLQHRVRRLILRHPSFQSLSG